MATNTLQSPSYPWISGQTVRASVYPPGGGTVGTQFPCVEFPAGAYSFRGTMSLSATSGEPYALELRSCSAQTDVSFCAATNSANLITLRGPWLHSDGTNVFDGNSFSSAVIQRNLTLQT